MNLGELIKALEAVPVDRVCVDGFGAPRSYRGYYEQLAFAPASNVTVGSMLEHARSAVGKTFEGYKGGTYLMDEDTIVNVAEYGRYGGGGDALTPERVAEMVGEVLPRQQVERLSAEVDRLREALRGLKRYGDHRHDCGDDCEPGDRSCTCGYDDAMLDVEAALSEPPPPVEPEAPKPDPAPSACVCPFPRKRCPRCDNDCDACRRGEMDVVKGRAAQPAAPLPQEGKREAMLTPEYVEFLKAVADAYARGRSDERARVMGVLNTVDTEVPEWKGCVLAPRHLVEDRLDECFDPDTAADQAALAFIAAIERETPKEGA